MILLDLTHTSHTLARTGIQRVCRSLYAALRERGEDVRPVCCDPYEETWRPLRRWELSHFAPAATAAAPVRSARWPRWQKIAGRLRRLARRCRGSGIENQPLAGALLVPEFFSADTGRMLPAVLARVTGPRAAIFYDAIPLRLPEFSPPKTVARYPAYLRELLQFDGVAAISDDSRQALLDYWRWLGVTNPPPVAGIPLGLDLPEDGSGLPSPVRNPASPPVVLSVGSVEGRKNHLALVDACERLWSRGLRFELRLIGLAQPQTARPALERISALQAAGRPLHYEGALPDATVRAAYRQCAFTVYPSLMEGFGLPVLESLGHGRPCVCGGRGALGESARGGGCLVLDRVDVSGLAGAIEQLLTDPGRLETLARAARGRTLKTWRAYAGEVTAWMRTLQFPAQQPVGFRKTLIPPSDGLLPGN